MSYLDKIAIQGIRSFDSYEPQVVQFYPLTIILGPNGAGKTSIIEALKYVTTGQTPPNSGGGKTFIMDPNIANTPIVRAQVKLSFTDISRLKKVVTRSMELRSTKSKSKTSLTFKSVGSTIRSGDNTIAQRCVDINNEMLELLGVSKAVLSNVIFCHQEDSNWPLSEGKVLKERFDDIFGSMGYVKALDKIKKLRKTELESTKLLQKDLEKWKHIKQEFDIKKRDLQKNETQLKQLKQESIESENKLKAVKKEFDCIISKEESIQSLSERINRIKGTINEKQKSLTKSKTSIKTLFNGSEMDLKSEIENFAVNSKKVEQNRNTFRNKESDLATNYSKLNEIQHNLNKDLTKLQIDEQNHNKLLKERNDLVTKLTNISIDSNILDKISLNKSLESNDIYLILKEMNEKLFELNNDLSNRKSSELEQIEDLSKEMNELKTKKNIYEHDVQLWNSQQNDKMKTSKELKSKLISFSKSETKYNEINNKIKALKEEIKQLEALDINKKKNDLQQKEKEKRELKNEFNLLEKQLKELQEQNEERIKFDLYNKEKKDKIRKRTQINEIHSEIIENIGVIDGQFHSFLFSRIQTISLQIETKSKELTTKENELTSESTKVDMKSESIRKMKRELKELETKLKKICKLEDYENVFNKVEKELKELRHKLSEISNYKPFIESQIDSIESSNCCPVCERDVSIDWNTKNGTKLNKQELVKNFKCLLNQISVEEIENEIKIKESQWNQLNGLRSTVQSILSLNENIPKLETEIESSVEQNTKLQTFIQKERILINKQKNDLNSMRDILQDASESDQIWTDIQELDKKISSIDINFDSEAKSFDDLSDELQLKRDQLEQIETKMTSYQNCISIFSENYTKRQNSLNILEKELLEIEKREHEMSSYKQKIEEFEAEIKVLDENIEKSQIKAMEMDPKIETIENQIKDTKQELEEFELKIQIDLNLIKEKQRDLERLNKQIEIYSKTGNSIQIKELTEKLTNNKNEIKRVENERQFISTEINRLSEEMSSFEVRKRELNDNLRVFEIQNEINNENNVLKSEEEKLGFSNIQELKSKKRELERQIKKFEAIKTGSDAQQAPHIENIIKLEDSLKTEPYKNSHKNFKQKFVELAISQISCEDLNKYYKALDFAVSDFHRKKIEEINKLIQSFWKQSYRGTDIDYIKIVSDEEERSADKRRTFNYRVVMVKASTEMDMRGRCSAGQKVLASLIIRLALAEIFCINCSVLALDEPTTNLDKHNIESFATAVTQIVKYRKKWKNSNFQLIIITHDEEFLRCLDSDTGQYYYKVFKNDSGFSRILRKSIADNSDQNSDNNN